MVVENKASEETIKGCLAFTLYLMGKSKYEVAQALKILADVLSSNYTQKDMVKYYKDLKFKD